MDIYRDESQAGDNWHGSAQQYLTRLGAAEYQRQRQTAGRKKTIRYRPTDYHLALIDCLNRDAEEEFKALKMLQGYASALGV